VPAHRRLALALLGALALAVAGCATVAPTLGAGSVQTHVLGLPGSARAAPGKGPSLLVAPPIARAGLDTRRMAYVQRPFELGYFARNEWADTPARMLHPLLVQVLEARGWFRAVVAGPNAATADLRLDTEILALQQEFLTEPSMARVALRAQLVDLATRQVLATRNFEAAEPAPSADPYGGVVALNRALATVLEDLAGFTASAASAAP
jgi:cholesterol transport system auxiliary component